MTCARHLRPFDRPLDWQIVPLLGLFRSRTAMTKNQVPVLASFTTQRSRWPTKFSRCFNPIVSNLTHRNEASYVGRLCTRVHPSWHFQFELQRLPPSSTSSQSERRSSSRRAMKVRRVPLTIESANQAIDCISIFGSIIELQERDDPFVRATKGDEKHFRDGS